MSLEEKRASKMQHILLLRSGEKSNPISYFIDANVNGLKYNFFSFTYVNISNNTASAALVTQDSLQIL